MRALYSLLMWLLQPFVRAKLRRRAVQEPEYGQHVEERFGVYGALEVSPGDGHFFVWVHAVSLGETRAASELIGELRTVLPGMRLLLTHGTATGRVQGRSLLQAGDVQVWQPWDTPSGVKRFLTHFQPRVGLLVETEIWPNMVAACKARSMPLCLVNARMSAKSLKQSLRLAWLARPAYASLRAVWAQAAPDAARLAELGAPVHGVFGNFKFDATPDAAQLSLGHAWRSAQAKPVIVFANTRDGEEVIFLQTLKKNQAVALANIEHTTTKNIANPKSSGCWCRATRNVLMQLRPCVRLKALPCRGAASGPTGRSPPTSGWVIPWVKWHCITRWRMWRSWAAALRRWAGTT